MPGVQNYGANATENITLLRTLAGPGGTGYDRCLHVSIVARIVRRRGIKFVVIVAVDAVVAFMFMLRFMLMFMCYTLCETPSGDIPLLLQQIFCHRFL